MPTHAERKIWRSLRRRKGREATGWFLAEGRRVVEEVVDAGFATEAILHAESCTDPLVRHLLDRAAAAGHKIEAVEARVIEEIADARTPQPVLAIAHIPARDWAHVEPGVVLVLDGVGDPGNVGGLARTAIALGCSAVIGVGETADPWGPKVVRASAGAVVRRPVFRTDAVSLLEALARRGVPLWVAGADGEALRRAARSPGAVALALGSEAHGVSAALREAAARVVAIPMPGGTESLNVAAAGAILLDRLTAQV